MDRKEQNFSRRIALTGTQLYILAVSCLVLGVFLGYVFHGAASPVAAPAPASVSVEGNGNASQGQSAQPQSSPEPQNASLAQAAAPLLANLKTSPNDFNTIVQLANLYFDGKQYSEAVKYYQLAVKSQPENVDLLTDLGTSIWYLGDADGAISEFQLALKYQPDHPETLFNLGVVLWQGKMDRKRAVQSWEQLLRQNPTYPQRQQVQEYIERVKREAKG